MREKRIKWLSVSTAVLGGLALVFLCLFISFCVSSNTYKKQLENMYMKHFYEMVSNINDLEVDMSKVVATTSIDSQRELLANIYQNASLCVNNINLLPVNVNNMTKVNNLLNTTSGFAYSLLLDNYNGKSINDNDFEQVSNLHSKIREVQYDLNIFLSGLRYNYSILDNVDFKDVESSDFSAGLVNTETSKTDVPTLIYDGPFSDSVLNKEIVGLSKKIYSKDDAENLLKTVFDGFGISYLGDALGKFETYNFEVKNNVSLYVSVTKKGGFVLSVNSFGVGKEKNISLEDALLSAETFAKTIGIENMYNVWHQEAGNVLYVNLAPIVNKVIYYSDLIKVKVDMSSGVVIGWEASSYATNHIDRSFISSIGIIDAMQRISPQLQVVERNFCIVPDKFVGEINAYEFICKWKDYTYYIYIDSITGDEVQILRVVNTTNGSLLQ